MSWLLLIKTGKFKRRKGPISAYTSDTSSKSESKLNGSSYSDTMKTNMYNSIGKQRNLLNNDKNLEKNTNNQSKASKDLHAYFDNSDYKYKQGGHGGQSHNNNDRRKLSASSEGGRPYSRSVENGNGHHQNGHRASAHEQERNGVTTIYTGRFSEARRSAGHGTELDEFTRL